MQLTPTFLPLPREFAGDFTPASYASFVALMTGWLLSHRPRFITELIQAAGRTRVGHHSRYHRFFSLAAWSPDAVFHALARLLVRTLAPTGLIELAVDDTLCRKRGLSPYGAGMHHDPLQSSKALKAFSWGHDWVVLGLTVTPPWAPPKVWCLPLLARLYRNRQGLTKGKAAKADAPGVGPGEARTGKAKGGRARGKKARRPADPNHRTRPRLAREMVAPVADWSPDRQLLLCGDSAYGGRSVLLHLPANVGLVSRAAANAALFAPAPQPVPGSRGRPRKKGARLPGMAARAADTGQPWQELTFKQFGPHATLRVKVRDCLYYKAGKGRLLRVVLAQDVPGKRPDALFYCTCREFDARTVLTRYSRRWAIEVTFEDCKQLLGLAGAANRLPRAVRRAAPMALVLYSLVVAWYHQAGHAWEQFPDRPWYPHKREASFADLLGVLRRRTWLGILSGVLSPTALAGKEVGQLVEFASRAA